MKLLKGTVSRDGFLEGLKILISTFCLCADGFQSLSEAFHFPYTITNFLFAALKLFTILKMLKETLLCDCLMFSSADLRLVAGKMRKN
jgi:hypothetical protein